MSKQFVLLPDKAILEKAQGFREARYQLSNLLHEISGDKRLRWCGYGAVNNIFVRINMGLTAQGHKRAGASGLIMCKRIWTCPVCSYKIANQRNKDLADTFRVWKQEHGSLLFITFTLSHKRNQPLKQVWDGINNAWALMLSGKSWHNFSTQYGAEGFVRATELTVGNNGWHVHYHTALFINKGFDTPKNIEVIREYLSNRWINSLNKFDFSASASIGVDVRRTYSDSGLSKYLNKFASELTQGHAKNAKSNNRTPFTILKEISESKDFNSNKTQRDLALWWEFEKVSKGRRQLVISKKVRALVKLTEIDMTSDDMIISPVTIMTISAVSWYKLKQARQVTNFYNKLETQDFASVLFWLSDLGISYTLTSAQHDEKNKELFNVI